MAEDAKNVQSMGWKSNGDILPLITAEQPRLSKDKATGFKLSTNPGQAGATTYDLTLAHVDDKSSLRQAIKLLTDLDRVFVGTNVTTFEPQKAIVESILRGSLIPIFRNHLERMIDGQLELDRRAAADAARAAGASDVDIQAARDAVVRPGGLPAYIPHALKQVVTHLAPHKALEKVKR